MAATTQFIIEVAYGAGTSNAGFTLTGFNSLASGSFLLASTAITANLDPFVDFSFSLKVGGTTVAGDFITLYALPLNVDGTTYGDGVGSGSTLPAAGYAVGSAGIAAGVTSGSVITGTIRGIIQPVQNYKFALANRTSVALNAAAAAAVGYMTYRENLNA